jgi:signal transduction histidine kinase
LCKPVYNEENKYLGKRGINRDITEQKRGAEKLVKALFKAEESDRLKSSFLANMSHEIRTPMNGILGFTELLKELDTTEEERQRCIEIIESSGLRLLNIINDLVDFSKIESGLMKIVPTDFDIDQQLEELYSFFKPEFEKKGLHIAYAKSNLSKKNLLTTDLEKLTAVLTNLLNNAKKYTLKGQVEFGYEIKKDYLKFFVKDTGIGIKENCKKMIFERFIQADASFSKSFEGSGLGLSISKAYVEMLGGKIWVESEYGVGSQFYFTIPYKAL